jgi:ABC-type Fe3+-hydroxamate transport system substrate-binding protein
VVRVVSLVPSATETLLALDVRPVGCTRFCDAPGIPTVGGTKNPDIDAIVALAPDLVVVNDEENRREDADALLGAGLALHSMSPRSLDEVGPAVAALAGAVGAAVALVPAPDRSPPPTARRSCVVFVWRRPWMTLAPDTYAASLLAALGVDQVLLGDSDGEGDRTVDRHERERYPETDLAEVAAAAPEVILLPSEPYEFTERHRASVAAAVPTAEVLIIDGRDLFWWGTRTPHALERLRVVLS